ncbi:MAG: SusD/RagB family nutrient-binding outer membrane lipoprotein [Bacteroidota bacterium]
MKKSILSVTLIALLVWSCDDLDLDLQDNPNQPAIESADINSLYNQLQLDLELALFEIEEQAGEVSRMYNATSPNYPAATLPAEFDFLWNTFYADFLPDVGAIRGLAEEQGLNIHLGTALVMEAYMLMAMVDVFVDIPFSEAGGGIDNLAPNVDGGESVYASADALLDEAIGLLSSPGDIAPDFDNFYGGDAAKWITLANTIKLRAAFLSGDAAGFNSIISGGDFIDDVSEDFQFNYGRTRINPNSRSQLYDNMWEQADGDYMSNYYMWLLRADKVDTDGTTALRDPRLRYYFFRKVNSSDRQPADSFGCLLSGLPDQAFKPSSWEGIAGEDRLPYCYASTDGYTGRDHLNGSGIPADGAIRTAYGLYPAAGDFDANDFVNTQNLGADGGQGLGILPIMLSSWVDFMRAEAALTLGTAGDPLALLVSGVEKSLNKVRGFESLVEDKMSSTITVNGVESTIRATFGMSDDDITDYIALVTRLYNEAGSDAERLDVIVKEFYLAAFGNGLEAFNMYRRTGMPANMQPALQPEGAGDFPRSFRYPNAFVDRNINANQKTEADRVFWDPGTSAVY